MHMYIDVFNVCGILAICSIFRNIGKSLKCTIYCHVLVACYDHNHKPQVAHHVEVRPGSALPLTLNDWKASLVVTIKKVGGVSTLRFEKLSNQVSASGLRI